MGMGETSTKPARRKEAASRSDFQAAYSSARQCCKVQPPQAPKCRQAGEIRAGLGRSTASSAATTPSPRFAPGETRTNSPGKVKAT